MCMFAMRRPLSDLLPNIEHPSSGPVDVREDHLGRASYRSGRSVNITDRVAAIGMYEFWSPSGYKATLQGDRRMSVAVIRKRVPWLTAKISGQAQANNRDATR